MAVPKGFRKNMPLSPIKVGPERRQELLDNIANQGTYLPRGVYYEDMDISFKEFVDRDLEVVISGEKVPVLFLSIQRWAEFSKTWQKSDKFKNIKMPFITIVRRPDVQVGTNQAGNWNIPQGKRTYTYLKVPTWNGNVKGVDIYKIPQPTAVDITYEVRLFCNRMRDLNKLHDIVQRTFQSRQHYVSVNGHPMPILLETISDESPIDDFENRRFYVQLFEMKMLGYLLNEDDFEVVPAVRRALVMTEVMTDEVKPKYKVEVDSETGNVCYNFIVKGGTDNDFNVVPENDIKFTDLILIDGVNSVTVKIDGVNQSLPFVVTAGQTMRIIVDKSSFFVTAKFMLKGIKL